MHWSEIKGEALVLSICHFLARCDYLTRLPAYWASAATT